MNVAHIKLMSVGLAVVLCGALIAGSLLWQALGDLLSLSLYVSIVYLFIALPFSMRGKFCNPVHQITWRGNITCSSCAKFIALVSVATRFMVIC